MTRSSDEARVRENLRLLGRQPVPLVSPEFAHERAERGVARLTAVLAAARQQRQRSARTRAILLAAAGVALCLVGAKSLLERSSETSAKLPASGVQESALERVTTQPAMAADALQGAARDHLLLRRDAAAQLVDGVASLRAGDVVETAQSSGRAELHGVTQVELSSDTRLTVLVAQATEQLFRLHRGTSVFHVDPARRARVVIETNDARVLVTGTRFSVTTHADAAGSWTAVDVTAGSVSVESAERSLRLEAGARWSSRLPAAELFPQAPSQTARRASEPGSSLRRDRSRTERSSLQRPAHTQEPARTSIPKERAGKTVEGTLTEENGLLQGALTARKQGSSARCVALLDQLITRYPRSPLRHEAVVLRFRCLRDGGHLARAKRAAQRYLDDYPNGAARDEANTLLLNR